MRRLWWVIAALLVTAAPVQAQRGARLEVALSPDDRGATRSPEVRAIDVLDDASLRDLLNSGFPAQLHFRLERWSSGGVFNNLEGRHEWDVIVRYNPLERQYTATRVDGDRTASLGTYPTLRGIETALARPYTPPAPGPAARGQFYFVATLDVNMLSVNDLDEVERWLKGELSPAVHGEKNPGTALGRGVKTLITRMLGGERRHYEARTGRLNGSREP